MTSTRRHSVLASHPSVQSMQWPSAASGANDPDRPNGMGTRSWSTGAIAAAAASGSVARKTNWLSSSPGYPGAVSPGKARRSWRDAAGEPAAGIGCYTRSCSTSALATAAARGSVARKTDWLFTVEAPPAAAPTRRAQPLPAQHLRDLPAGIGCYTRHNSSTTGRSPGGLLTAGPGATHGVATRTYHALRPAYQHSTPYTWRDTQF